MFESRAARLTDSVTAGVASLLGGDARRSNIAWSGGLRAVEAIVWPFERIGVFSRATGRVWHGGTTSPGFAAGFAIRF